MSGPLLAIDGPFVLYRSFFALPDSIQDDAGHPVNALLGATNLILRIAADRSPRAIVVCFGAEAAKYRVELYPGYHAHRPPVPDALEWQFEQAPALFESFCWMAANSPELEADDLLGSLAAAEASAGGRGLILTGDRDMYQCATDRISILYLKQGSSGFDEVDPAEVKRRYGIEPDRVPDFIALRGDPSDGLPGAPGIGAKTATALLEDHGSLEGVLAAAQERPRIGTPQPRPRVAATLRESADALRAFREIATLRSIQLELPPDRPTDLQAGAAAARRFGMNRLGERLEKADSLAQI